jgi:molybdopterin/thiamine biosynthesis adenylyltransferase/rhodanese-related sulfurtransferase
MAMTREERMAALRATLPQVDVVEAFARQARGERLIDVREAVEWADGTPPGALRLARSQLEFQIDAAVPDRDTPLLLLCAAGGRALLSAESLQAFGYTQTCVVAGGFTAWKAAGLPVEIPAGSDPAFRRRYGRQIILSEIGEAGQLKLAAAKLLIVGAGGLGSPSALYLAAAGVGQIGIVDDDRVDESNLQRQVLHTQARVGRSKVQSAVETLGALNPGIRVDAIEQRISSANVDALVGAYDLILDGSDNLPTRYLLSDAAVKHGKALVYGAVERFVGQVSVFHPGSARGQAPCYRCLFPEPPSADQAPNCAEVGVLGVVPGIIGLLQANEVLKLLLGIGKPLIGRLLLLDALGASTREIRLSADPACPVCAPGIEFPGYIDYAQFCAHGTLGR